MNGSVYIATNTYLPDLIKIGRSKDPAQRMIELSGASGVPGSFVLAYHVRVGDMAAIEGAMHRRFAARRVRGSEFFRMSAREARRELDKMASRERTVRLLSSIFVPQVARLPWPFRMMRALAARPAALLVLVALAGLVAGVEAMRQGAEAPGMALLAAGGGTLLVFGRGGPRKRRRARRGRWSMAEMIALIVGVTVALGFFVQRHGVV